jgi:hypothetical protein
MRFQPLLAALAAATLAGGCATVTRTKADDQLLVESEPPGATIFVNRKLAGTTPRLVPMPRDHEIEVRCSLEGHRDSVTTVRRELSQATNFDDPLFAVIDELTGAAYQMRERRIYVELVPLTRR